MELLGNRTTTGCTVKTAGDVNLNIVLTGFSGPAIEVVTIDLSAGWPPRYKVQDDDGKTAFKSIDDLIGMEVLGWTK